MKKILMLLPLLVFLAGCNKEGDMSTPPASTNNAATNAPAK
jgi:predicted small lipoprotein YifL